MGRTSNAREKLIEVAQRLFLTQSYTSVSVDKICREAAINKGSFYYFFSSKRDLLLAVVEQNWAYLQGFVFQPSLDPDLKPLQRIERFFMNLYDGNRQTKASTGQTIACPVGMIGAEMSNYDDVVRHKIDEVFLHIRAFFESILEEAKAAGEISKELDSREIAERLVAYYQGVMLVAQSRDEPEVIKLLARGALSLVD